MSTPERHQRSEIEVSELRGLHLTRQRGQSVVIGQDTDSPIVVGLVDIKRNRVKLKISATEGTNIVRDELIAKKGLERITRILRRKDSS